MPPLIHWQTGTAYDLLVSLYVLHQPGRFGLRPAWAAGVRNRLLPDERRCLLTAQSLFNIPLPWLHQLSGSKDCQPALKALAALPPEQRLPALAFTAETPPAVQERLLTIAARRSWQAEDLDALRSFVFAQNRPLQPAGLDCWAYPAEFGQRYLEALNSYYANFFAEEEQRIVPSLQAAAERSRRLVEQLDLPGLVEVLSHGVHFPGLENLPALDLVPSYWITPLIFYHRLQSGGLLLVFGARSEDAALSPGSPASGPLLASLKALADPTRLSILRLLSGEALTLSQLARRLRLRLPTISHHLGDLRLAGLVQVDLQADGEKRYTIRRLAVQAVFQGLEDYLDQPGRQG